MPCRTRHACRRSSAPTSSGLRLWPIGYPRRLYARRGYSRRLAPTRCTSKPNISVDADRHITSLHKTYILLVVLTAILVFLFVQQYIRGNDIHRIKQLDLVHGTYQTMGSTEFPDHAALPGDLFTVIYGEDLGLLIFSIKEVRRIPSYVVISAFLRSLDYIARQFGFDLNVTKKIRAIFAFDTPYDDMYYIPQIPTHFTFGGLCSAIAAHGPASSKLTLPARIDKGKLINSREVSLSELYVIIYSLNCTDTENRVVLMMKNPEPPHDWLIFIPLKTFRKIIPTASPVRMRYFEAPMDNLLEKINFIVELKDAALELSQFWKPPTENRSYIDIDNQSVVNSIIYFSSSVSGHQWSWDRVEPAIDGVLQMREAGASVGGLEATFSYWLVIAPWVALVCSYQLQRRIRALTAHAHSVTGPWLVSECRSLIDHCIVWIWAFAPVVFLLIWGAIYTFATRTGVGFSKYVLNIWSILGVEPLPIVGFTIPNYYSTVLLVVWLASVVFVLYFCRGVCRLLQMYKQLPFANL